jgi:Flp pilus assembly protein TadG
MVSTAAGFLVFILLLLLAVQVLYGLYARSTLQGTLDDVASRAANGRTTDSDLRRLASEAERSLGAMGPRTTIELRVVDGDGDGVADWVAGSAVADPPRFIPQPFRGVVGADDITVAVQVRIERFR